ncbi:MAG: hypothetical protein WC765_07000 [Phycisphaerae bacterium]|jgi:hypothetical protein
MKDNKIKDRRVRTIKQLKELAKDENGLDCFILLNGGLRSSKHIRYYPDDNSFYVLNLIDSSEQELTESQILDKEYTNIGEAMEKGALIMDEV